jgi:ketopantoate reductase
MRFVILGAGALGSIIAGHLARAGEDVMVVARGDRAGYLRQHGITITGLADFTISCPVITDPMALRGADVLIVAVKTYDMAAALAPLRHLEVATVLSIQNGVLKNEQLAETFGPEKTVGAATLLSGSVGRCCQQVRCGSRSTKASIWGRYQKAPPNACSSWARYSHALAFRPRRQCTFRPSSGRSS